MLVCQVESYLKILKPNHKPLVFTSYKAFSKKQRIWTSLLISFSAWLLKKSISFVIMCFRVGSRSPMTFKTKLSVTTVNSSFQVIPIFYHKELYLRYCIGLVVNIVTWSTKHLKDMRGHLPWLSAILGKYEKLTLLDTLKIHFQTFFALDQVFLI